MIKCLFAFPRAEGMTRAQCLDHYRNRHAPTVHGVPEFRREMKRYVQNNILGTQSGIPAELDISIVDGLSEVWFTDVKTMVSLFEVPAYMDVIRIDELRFTDTTNVRLVVAEEHVMSGDVTSPKFKLIRFIAKKSDVSNEAAQSFWKEVYGPAMMVSAAFRKSGTGYVQNHAVDGSLLPFPTEFPFIGVEEIWCDDMDSLASFSKAQSEVDTATGADKFFSSAASMRFATQATLLPGWGQ